MGSRSGLRYRNTWQRTTVAATNLNCTDHCNSSIIPPTRPCSSQVRWPVAWLGCSLANRPDGAPTRTTARVAVGHHQTLAQAQLDEANPERTCAASSCGKSVKSEPPKGHGEMWQWYLSGSSWGVSPRSPVTKAPAIAAQAALSEYDKRRAHGTKCASMPLLLYQTIPILAIQNPQ